MAQGILGRVVQFVPGGGIRLFLLFRCSGSRSHLEELDDGAGEGESGGLLLHVLRGQLVLHHELGQVAHDLAAWSHLVVVGGLLKSIKTAHLDNVAEEQVGLPVFLLHHLKLVAQAQAVGIILRQGHRLSYFGEELSFLRVLEFGWQI